MFSLQYYSESHGIIYVIDSHDRERIEESKEAFGKLFRLDPYYMKVTYS